MSNSQSSEYGVESAKPNDPLEREVDEPGEVDQLQEVETVLEYLTDLRDACASATAGDWRQTVTSALIDLFASTARSYAALARKIITWDKKYHTDLPDHFYYGEVLRKIDEHVSQLALLCVDICSDGQQSPLDRIQAIISVISRHVPGGDCPQLVPVLFPRFMYVHLTYAKGVDAKGVDAKGVGIIGVPAYALGRSYPNLPILWHEVAGHWVAQLKTGGELKRIAKALKHELQLKHFDGKTLWDCYQDLFVQSRFAKATVTLKTTQGQIELREPKGVSDYFAQIDKNDDWQMRWFGQILEDFFGVRELDKTMLDSLEVALSRVYKKMDIGDFDHPPADLRLDIARAYLGEVLQAKSDQTQELARFFADKLRTLYPAPTGASLSAGQTGAPRGVSETSDPAYEQLVQFVKKNVVAPRTYGARGPKYDAFKKDISTLVGNWPSTHGGVEPIPLEASTEIWKQAGFTESEYPPAALPEPGDARRAQTLLTRLRRIKLIEMDPIAGAKNGTSLELIPPI